MKVTKSFAVPQKVHNLALNLDFLVGGTRKGTWPRAPARYNRRRRTGVSLINFDVRITCTKVRHADRYLRAPLLPVRMNPPRPFLSPFG